jgi:hypothetical protein
MGGDSDRAQIETKLEDEPARPAAPPAFQLIATRCCRYCDEPLQNPKQLFCDDDCSHDYDLLERLLAMYRG